MEERKFKYDAFISYRHTELDKFVAENLIKELESFKLPRNVAKKLKGKKTKIERVFRDREELPLTNNLEEPIVEALKDSEWLIVICSPRLPESVWCKKEIETFISLRGREHVLAVLIEGEPSESFPEELLYKVEEVELEDGSTKQAKVAVEPLAADFRGKGKKGVLKAMKTEKLRLLAAMFGVAFDDLRQRHRERRMRRIAGISLVVGATCLAFGVYSTITAMRIQKQKEQIETQSEQIMAQSDEILKQNEEIKLKSDEIQKQSEAIQKQNDELALRQAKSLAEKAEYYLNDGNRSAAIQTAVEALTENEGIAMPYTTQAEMILVESTRAYDIGEIYKAQYQYESLGKIETIEESMDGDTLAILDDAEYLTLYDVKNQEVIKIFESNEYDIKAAYGFTFLGEDRFAYIGAGTKVCIYDLTQREVVGEIEVDSATSVDADAEGKYLLIEGDGFRVYDGHTLEFLGTTPSVYVSRSGYYQYVCEEGILADIAITNAEDGSTNYTLFFVDLNTMELLGEYPLGEKVPKDIKVKDGIAYVMSDILVNNKTDADSYTAAVSIADGSVLWENVQYQHFSSLLLFPHGEDATDLLAATGESFRLINMQTGEVSFEEDLSASPVSAYKFVNSNNFLIFCEDGQMYGINHGAMLRVDLSDRFECVSPYNKYIFYSNYGMAVNADDDNMITFYTVELGPKAERLDYDIQSTPGAEEYLGEAAFEIARDLGLEKPEFIDSIFYSADERYCIVEYWDERIVIVKMGVGIVSTIETEHPVHALLGPDTAGRSYLIGTHGCYILNQDMSPIAWVANAVSVDVEEQKIYLEYGSNSYVTPVYTLDELLKIAEEKK